MAFTVESELGKLEEWTRDITRGMDRDGKRKFLRAAALEFLRRVIRRTPVDTGRARAGWTAFLDAEGVPVHIGGNDADAIREGKKLSRFETDFAGTEQYIEVDNGVVYIVELEFGHSQQAPRGMVRITILEMTGRLDQHALDALDDVVAEADRKARFV